MKQHTLLIGAVYNEKLRIQLRAQQCRLANAGVPVLSILDFAREGQDEPDVFTKNQVLEFMATHAKQIVVGQPDADWCPVLMDIAKDLNMPIIEFRDIDFQTKTVRKSFIQRINEFLYPWFTNPMKLDQRGHAADTTIS